LVKVTYIKTVLSLFFFFLLPFDLFPSPLPQGVIELKENAEEAFIWGDYRKAKKDYLNLISTWADPELLLKSRYRLALCLERLNQRKEAIRAYQLLLFHIPQAEEVKRSLAKLYLEEGNYQATLVWLSSCKEKRADILFQMGYCYAQLGEWREGIIHLEALTPDYPLYDYVLYLLGRGYLDLGESSKSIDALSRIPQESLLYRDSQRTMVRAYSRGGNYQQALRMLEGWEKDANYLFRIGEIYGLIGEKAKSLTYYLRLIKSFPRDPLALRAGERIEELKGKELGPEERFLIGKVLFHSGEWRASLDQLGSYLKASPRGRWADEANFLEANCLFKLGDYTRARSLYLSLISKFPHSSFSPKSKFQIALCDWRLEKMGDAFWRFRDFSLRYPTAEHAERALFLAGSVLAENGDYRGAANQYLMAQARYPKDKLADQSLWRAAFCLYQDGDYLRSLSLLKEFSQLYDQSPFLKTTLYWTSKLCQKMGKVNQAKKILKELARKYPYSYYGLKAKSLLSGEDIFTPFRKSSSGLRTKTLKFKEQVRERSCFSTWIKGNFPPKDSLSLEEGLHFHKGKMLADLGLAEEAKKEFVHVEKTEWGNPRALSGLLGLYSQLGWDLRGHKVASWIEDEAKRRGVEDLPSYLLRWLYPVHLRADVWERCRRANLDPLFILALIRRESRFDLYATSRSGALGLMQIMPATGKEVARSLGRKEFSSKILYQKDINLDLGVHYLVQQLYRFGGRPEMALAAYNGGPTNVLRWKRGLEEPLDIDLFVERIDYSQTRSYLKMVLKDYFRYKEIWEGK
jgi:soluble lytic murein transglycosylase